MKDVYIIGAGTYGEVMFDLAEHCGYNVVGFFDDDKKKVGVDIFGQKVRGKTEDLFASDLTGVNVVVAIGNNHVRNILLNRVREQGGKTPTLVHNTVTLTKNVRLGKGVYIQPNATLWTSVKIENNCIVSPGVVIAHHSTLKEGSFVSTLSGVGAGIIIEEEAFLGMAVTVVTGVKTVGRGSVIGAGSVVIRNVPPGVVVAGVPAKKLRDI
jgi:UDP-perosamine 4-acetyltransferase